MKTMAELTGFMSLLFWFLMILSSVIGATYSPLVTYTAVLFALWSIGWTVRDTMEAKKGKE